MAESFRPRALNGEARRSFQRALIAILLSRARSDLAFSEVIFLISVSDSLDCEMEAPFASAYFENPQLLPYCYAL